MGHTARVIKHQNRQHSRCTAIVLLLVLLFATRWEKERVMVPAVEAIAAIVIATAATATAATATAATATVCVPTSMAAATVVVRRVMAARVACTVARIAARRGKS